MSLWDWLMNPAGLTAHGFCLSWAPGLIALHAGSDALIGLAYFSIPVALGALARGRPEMRYGGIIYLFMAFIVACGTTHFMSILTLWIPVYGIEGVIKGITALVSAATAVILWPLLPRVIALPSGQQMARLNHELAATVARQRETEALLRESEERVRAANRELARRVEDKTEELKTANDRLRGIVDSALDALITIDNDQNIVLFNPAAARMFDVRAEDALGAPIDRFIPAPFRDSHPRQMHDFMEAGVTARSMGALRAVRGLRADGEEFPVEASISKVQVGGLSLATVIMRDITEREANEAARQLLSREVDHRAKNALAIVQAVVSLTQAPTKEAFVQAVRGRIAALARAHSLLASSQWQGGDLIRIIADEVAPYQKPGQVTIRGTSVVVNPNAVQPIGLIIHELATNALKYGALSVSGGHVDVETRVLPSQELRLTWAESGGKGVTAPKSTGFGTTLVTQIARRQLGGKIETAWLDQGLRLTATLPASSYRRAPTPGDAARRTGGIAEAGEVTDVRVLVVEDELLIALALCDGLRGLGWTVVGPASSVEEALSLISTTARIDVAILDINLGGEMAFPVAEVLRGRGTPFVFCTGYEQPEGVERFTTNPIFRKPIDVRALAAELQRLAPAA